MIMFLKKIALVFCFLSFYSNHSLLAEVQDLEIGQYLGQIPPSDDPNDYNIDTTKSYRPTLSDIQWVSPNGQLPAEVIPQKSNNNVSIALHQGKLFLAFRTSKNHFAGKTTKLYVISTQDGVHWDYEMQVALGKDAREPLLSSFNNILRFYYFTAGKKSSSFEPDFIMMHTRSDNGTWDEGKKILEKGEVPWEMKSRGGKLWLTSYRGSHYKINGPGKVELHFKTSDDGEHFVPVDSKKFVYFGGVSEAGFEFDIDNNLWAVTRNEDGDQTGLGSHVVFAPRNHLGEWQFPAKSNREAFMSPKMFRHGNDLYLIGRKQRGKKPFDRAPFIKNWAIRKLLAWLGYSASPKGTALYRINQKEKKVEFVMDLPGTGDTAFPSIRRLDAHTFLIANYTADLNRPNLKWIEGQLTRTGIYLIKLKFEAN